MRQLRLLDVFSLPIHDAIAVNDKNYDLAKSAMEEAWYDVMKPFHPTAKTFVGWIGSQPPEQAKLDSPSTIPYGPQSEGNLAPTIKKRTGVNQSFSGSSSIWFSYL